MLCFAITRKAAGERTADQRRRSQPPFGQMDCLNVAFAASHRQAGGVLEASAQVRFERINALEPRIFRSVDL
jgi:hypothetical protein